MSVNTQHREESQTNNLSETAEGGILSWATSVTWQKVLESATVELIQCLSWKWTEPSQPRPPVSFPPPSFGVCHLSHFLPTHFLSFLSEYSPPAHQVPSSHHIPNCSRVAPLTSAHSQENRAIDESRGGMCQKVPNCMVWLWTREWIHHSVELNDKLKLCWPPSLEIKLKWSSQTIVVKEQDRPM